jgi:hypothetical protein
LALPPGNFQLNLPSGEGTFFWENGARCSGEIADNFCVGTMTTPTGKKIIGKFEWKFDHDNHGFEFGKLKYC